MIPLFLIPIFVCLVLFTAKVDKTVVRPEPKLYPSPELQYLHFGFRDAMADSFWVRVIQNIDFCHNKDAKVAANMGIGVDDILAQELKPSRCHKGWVFQMLDLITNLAPKFRRVYRIGADILSVAVDDREGARIIYDKGIKNFPNYWELAYSASYHYLFEYQNPSRAGDLLIQAAEAGGPTWFRQMAGTLYTRSGQLTLAEITLKDFIIKYHDQRGGDKAAVRLAELYVKKGMSEEEAKLKVDNFKKQYVKIIEQESTKTEASSDEN